MEKVLKSGRIDYKKSSPYNNKVYIGNWLEDRCKYIKEKHHHISLYMQDYDFKPDSKLDSSVMSDAQFKGYGCGARLLLDHNGDNYMNNMCTLADLTYNHLPKMVPNNRINRHWRFRMNTWEPEQDCCKNFGNLTNYGITEYKKRIWEDSKLDSRCPPKSDYQDTFLPPTKEDYNFRRWGIPIPNSSIMNKVNSTTVNLQYRDIPINSVTPNEDLIIVPRQPRCNQITWECPDKDPLSMIQKPCVTQKM